MKLPELETFFEEYYKEHTPKEIKLSNCETIVDPIKFWKSHVSYLKGNPGNVMFMPYYRRLLRLYELLRAEI